METEAKGNWANRKVSDSGQAVSGARKKGMPKWAKIGLLMVGLILVITESIVFAGSRVGWFDDKKKVEISSEYVCGAGEVPEFINVDAPGYEQLAAEKKSFVIFVDQGGCATADGLRERLREGGLRTAQGRDWETLRAEIVETYRGAAGMAVEE